MHFFISAFILIAKLLFISQVKLQQYNVPREVIGAGDRHRRCSNCRPRRCCRAVSQTQDNFFGAVEIEIEVPENSKEKFS